MSQYPAGSYETQFEARSDDEENLYNVEKILAEKGGKYLVQWEGIDPTTGEKWAPDWVPKTDCTDDLIADWKREKAAKKQKKRGASVKSISSASGSVDVPARHSKSRPVFGRATTSRATEGSTSTRSRSPVPPRKPTTTSRRPPSFYIEIPAPQRTKRRRESDIKPEPVSPIKRMKLGGPASPLPGSPFDDDDGEVGAMFPKKRSAPITYKRRKPAVVKSPAFPKLAGPYVRENNVAGPSRSRDPYPEPTKRRAKGNRKDEDYEEESNTDTVSEADSLPVLHMKPKTAGRTSPLKSKSEPIIKPRTRNATRNAPPEPDPPRASSVPYERPHPTSAARTRELPSRNRAAQREIRKQITLGLPGPPADYPRWPWVVTRDETTRRRSDTKSRTSSATNTSRKSVEKTSVAGPSVPPKDAPAPEAEMPRPLSPPPSPTPHLLPDVSPDESPKRSSLAKSTAGSSGRPSSAKSVSFRVDGVDDLDEYQADYAPPPPEGREIDRERIMSSVESENEPSPREPTEHAPAEQARSQSQSQSQSNSDSSKSTHISDSQDGTEAGGKKAGNLENEEANQAEVKDLELVLHEPHEEEQGEEDDSEEEEEGEEGEEGEEEEDDQEEEGDDQDQDQDQEDDHDEIQSEEALMHSSPSLGGDIPDLPPANADAGSSSREVSPAPDIQFDQSLDLPGDTTNVSESLGLEQAHLPQEPSEETDGDTSMAYATEVDMLLSSDVSHRSEQSEHEMEQEEDSTPAPDDKPIDPPESSIDDTPQEHRAEVLIDITQALTDSSSGRVPAPDSRTAIDHPTTREVISTLLPGILDTPSQSQSQSQSQSHSLTTDTQDRALIPPALPAQIISSVLQLSQSQPEKTHSSIEEPASSWAIPRPGQQPLQNDTISNFTPTNPGIKPSPAVPSPESERILPSSFAGGINGQETGVPTSQELPSQVNGSAPSQETSQDRSRTPLFPVSNRSSELGAVPELSVEVFKQSTRDASPMSDIGEFSPRKSSPVRPSSQSSEKASVRPYQQRVAHHSSPGPWETWSSARRVGRTSLHGSPSFRFSASEDTKKQIQDQATRIQALLADLASLEATKKAIEAEAAVFVDTTKQLNDIIQQEREARAEEAELQSATILDLQKQLEVARSQYETAELQREFALEQYTRASTEAKRISDENKVLEAKVETLERSLSSGLRQWQIGFESNVERHQQEVQMLKGQLTVEREIYTRSKAPEVCRRAAEWYELKKQIKELEEDAAEAERREATLRERELEIRRKELAIADREQALEDSMRTMQSQAPTTRHLSQDDLQTETMLTDRSAVLADLDGDLGDEMVWMCSYRESTGKICGKVFDTMGMLLSHVLDAAGHKVEAACDCA
ncbi:Nascent polypeptide-associated complex subunit alpha, muscle-specific form [Rhizoctonia solani]|uniref:Nascent polypeptide-associated complex subunit alpha, muscle-specific form n=1 Tax=Rhizoctonia solani TaxID=456999 RepID=A0A0K6GET1_9AGAM|nr:Nascent polypeptide-associated complex subunit alpha, muscle-specific form [Rhizoctonia solani]